MTRLKLTFRPRLPYRTSHPELNEVGLVIDEEGFVRVDGRPLSQSKERFFFRPAAADGGAVIVEVLA